MKIPNTFHDDSYACLSLARIVSEDSQPAWEWVFASFKSSKDS